VQGASNRRLSQLVVGDAAPQKEREPRRQIQIAEAIGRSGRGACRPVFDAKKARRGEDALDSALNAGVKTAFARAVW
jgi:hypothetical protein